MDHGFGDVDALFVVACLASPAGHPAKCALDDPAARKDLETLCAVGTLDDFDHEFEVIGFVHELGSIIGTVSKQMLQPRLAFAHGVEDELGACAIGDICGRQVEHKKPPVGIHRDVALTPSNLFADVIPSHLRPWGLDGLAVNHPAGRARLAALDLPVEHEHHVVDGMEKEAPNETAKMPINRLQ